MRGKLNDLSSLNEKLARDGGNILLIQTAFLGDVILLTPLIGALRRLYSNCRISAITRTVWAEVIANLVDEIIPYEKAARSSQVDAWEGLMGTIEGKNFDLAIIPHRSFRSGYLARKAGIRHRIGFNRGGGRYLHTVVVEYPQHEYEGIRNLRLLEPLARIDFKVRPFLKPSAADDIQIQSHLSAANLEAERYIVIAPGSIWKTKRWLDTYYRSLIAMIKDRHGLEAMLIGSEDDRNLCGRIALRGEFNLAGQLTPLQSAAMIAHAKLVISGDSAPAHMATAMNCRQIIILGSTSPRFGFAVAGDNVRCAGLDLWCRPCTNHGRKNCPLAWNKLQCLSKITPTDIYNLVKDWLP